MTVSDAKRFVREIKLDATSNPIGNAAKKIIETLGFGPGSVKAKEDAARRDKIADALAEAGAEPQHVDAARVAMTIQAADAKGKGGKKKGTMSGLEAAAQVLASATEPMNVKQITERAIALGWAPEGATPAATLSAAMQREIKAKGAASRFAKAGTGLFMRNNNQ